MFETIVLLIVAGELIASVWLCRANGRHLREQNALRVAIVSTRTRMTMTVRRRD